MNPNDSREYMFSPLYHGDEQSVIVHDGMPQAYVSQFIPQPAANEVLHQCSQLADTTHRQAQEIEYLHGKVEAEQREKENAISDCMESRNALMRLTAKYELLKSKAPISSTREFLDHRQGVDTVLNLVTQMQGRRCEARIPIGNAVVEKAIWVEETDGSYYLAAMFVFCDCKKEVILYIPEKIYFNSGQLLSHLCRNGITLESRISPSRKAALWKEYLARVTAGNITRLCNYGWVMRNGEWEYRLEQTLPWWDRRKKQDTKSTEHPEEHTASSEPLFRILADGSTSTEIKLLIYTPYMALLTPVLAANGLGREKLLNVVVEKNTPIRMRFIQRCLGQSRIISLPIKMKTLRDEIRHCSAPVFLSRVELEVMTSSERKLLQENLEYFFRMESAEALPVIISAKPLSLLEDAACILRIGNFSTGAFYSFAANQIPFQKFLVNAAPLVEKMIKLKNIPSQLEDFGGIFEQFRVTAMIIKTWLDQDFCMNEAKNDEEILREYFLNMKINADQTGLTEMFVSCMQRAVEDGVVTITDRYTPVTPDSIIVTDDEVYFRRSVFGKILSSGMAAFNELSVLQALEKNNILRADKGRKINYKIRRALTNEAGETVYAKVIVLKKDEITKKGELDFLG